MISVHLEDLWKERKTEETTLLPEQRGEESEEEDVQEWTSKEHEAKEEAEMC